MQFVCELPSIKGKSCAHDVVDAKPSFHLHQTVENTAHEQEFDLDETFFKAKQVISEAFQLCRRRATEVMVFMGSDLDRMANFGCGHSIPIAYGLHGPSLKIEVVRKMLQEVLQATEEQGWKPICFSSDGQFINIITKDFDGQPLTQLQM